MPALPPVRELAFAPGAAREGAGNREPCERPPREHDAAADRELTPVDALELLLCPPVIRGEAAAAAVPRGGVEPWVQEIVRQIAWGGDRRRGAARIELGAGRFAGASVVVAAEGGSVTLEVRAPAGVDGGSLGERLRERLETRGLVVRDVVVRSA